MMNEKRHIDSLIKRMESGEFKSLVYCRHGDHTGHKSLHDFIRPVTVSKDIVLDGKTGFTLGGMAYEFNNDDMYKNLIDFNMKSGLKVDFLIVDLTGILDDRCMWKMTDIETGKVIFNNSVR